MRFETAIPWHVLTPPTSDLMSRLAYRLLYKQLNGHISCSPFIEAQQAQPVICVSQRVSSVANTPMMRTTQPITHPLSPSTNLSEYAVPANRLTATGSLVLTQSTERLLYQHCPYSCVASPLQDYRARHGRTTIFHASD